MDAYLVAKRLLEQLASPLGATLLLLAASAVCARLPRLRTLSPTCAAAAFTLLLLASLPAVSFQLLRPLERSVPRLPVAEVPAAETLVLLGGGLRLPLDPSHRATLSEFGDRLALARTLHASGKAGRIVISGARSRPVGPSEAAASAALLREWGVPREAIELETRARNTRQNARFVARRLRGDGPVLLVTSAFHLPRALAAFCAAGVDAIGVPAGQELLGTVGDTLIDYLPGHASLGRTARALNEYLSIAAYLLSGSIEPRHLRRERRCAAPPAPPPYPTPPRPPDAYLSVR